MLGGEVGRVEEAADLARLRSPLCANQGWVLAANIACGITAWTRLLGLHDQPELAHAEPETLRYRLLHLPATLSSHARRKTLKIAETWPWTDVFILCWQRLTALPT